MTPPIFDGIFIRLPPATAVLLLSAVFDLTAAHALPQQTKVVAFHELDVIPFPPAPTGDPLSSFGLELRQLNAICGYIGGDKQLPATCSAGSHCVLDSAHSVVGCCPNEGACTTGIFTSCVDRNSHPQTVIDLYVYTCQGADVCFKNNFAGGYHQYGCGTASELGTTVHTSADGATAALTIETVDISLTRSPSTIGSPSSSSKTTSRSTSKTTSHTSTSTSTSTSSSPSSTLSTSTSSQKVPTATPTESPVRDQLNRAAIIGGVVGGVAAVIIVIALAIFCLRRRNRNRRVGPGPTPTAAPTTQYISPMQSHGAAFAPLPSWHDEDGPSSRVAFNPSHPPPPVPYGPLDQTPSSSSTTLFDDAVPRPPDMAAAPHNFSQPLRYNQAYLPINRHQPKGSLTPVSEEGQSMEREESQEREIDDFSRAYSVAGIGQLTDDTAEEDRTPLRGNSQDSSEEEQGSTSPRGGGHRPLWQQNRQQRRNLMWL